MSLQNRNVRWTIYDIAREAGVSPKTVSRVLNDKPGVGKQTRARIREIMERVGFHAHMGARTMRGKQSGCIGVTVPAPVDMVPLSQGFFVWLFAELFRIFGSQGEYVCFDFNPYGAAMNGDYGRGVWQQLYKACVVAGPLALEDRVIKRIHDSGIPYLAFGRLDSLPDCSSATVDYEEGAYVSTKFLLNRGHTRIAMLKAFKGFQPGLERRRGYLRALREAGVPADERLIYPVTFGARNIANVIHRLLTDYSVTALIDCSGTEDSESLREGARRAGRVPGKDFETVVWTYADKAHVLPEASAHVWMPVREAAAEGLEWLAGWVRGAHAGPVKVLYHCILTEGAPGAELPKPRRLFELLD